MGKPQSYVSKVETCERRIDVIEAIAFCEALGIRLRDILPVGLQKFVSEWAKE